MKWIDVEEKGDQHGSRFLDRRAAGRERRGRLHRACFLEPLEGRLLFAAVFNVNSTADLLNPPPGVVTLRSAISAADAAPGGNIINLTIPGTYQIAIPGAGEDQNATGDFDIRSTSTSTTSGSLNIINTSGGTVIVDGKQLDRVFDINPSANTALKPFTVSMQGFTIENGAALPGDGSGGSGGGIRAQGNASLTLTNMAILNNTATADGGGIAIENLVSAPWTLTIDNSTISGNHAGDSGGGIESDGSGTINAAADVITGNSALNDGGGVWLDSTQAGTVVQGANLNMTEVIVSDNVESTAGLGGGGVGNAGNGAVSIGDSVLSGNFSAGSGGAFVDVNGQGTLSVVGSLIENNGAAGNGGAISDGGPITTILGSEIQGNTSGGSGGGIFASGNTLTIQQSTLAANTAAVAGGGALIQTSGTGGAGSRIVDSTFAGNSALTSGGNATGGGIAAPPAFTGALSLVNDTIAGNQADDGGGIFWAGTGGSTVAAQNTIIAANLASVGPDANNPAGTFTDSGGNLIGVAGAGSGNTGFNSSTTQRGTVASPLAPGLGSLQDNGGLRAGGLSNTVALQTMAPLPGSPAIAHGLAAFAPATDERGFPSVVNGTANVGAVSQGSATINGLVFNDLNHDGVRELPAEPGLSGVTVYLDTNGNGKPDPGELTTTTDASGNYTFTNLLPTSYIVRQVVPAGYLPTAPPGGGQTVSALPGKAVAGPQFGDTQISTVTLDFAYLIALARHYDTPGTFATGDLNGDGIVNFADLLILAHNFGHPLPSSAATTSLAPSSNVAPSFVSGALRRRHALRGWHAGHRTVKRP